MAERLKKRGRIWYAWVPCRDGGTRLVSTRCTDKTAALIRVRDLERRAVDPGYAAAQKTTTRELLGRYLASRERLGRSEGTLHHVRVKSGHLARLLPHVVADITHTVLESYVDARRGEDARLTTIKKELRVLGGAWRLGRRNKMVPCDVSEVMPELTDDYEPRTRALSAEEAWAVCLALPPKRAAVVAFSVATGAEWSAVQRARREDVDVDGGMVHLRGTKRKTRDRWTPIPLPLQRLMLGFAVRHGDGIGGQLFAAWSNVRHELNRACKLAGIEQCSPNDLRRTFGTWLRDAGIEPQLIAPAMGHVDSRMVERVYGRLTPEALARNLALAVRNVSERPRADTDPESSTDAEEPGKEPRNVCPGTESNRRHGDFQSNPIARETSANPEITVGDCTVCVDLTLAEEPPPWPWSEAGRYRLAAGRIEPLNGVGRRSKAAWDALRGAA